VVFVERVEREAVGESWYEDSCEVCGEFKLNL
jgi:hypothetical protein